MRTIIFVNIGDKFGRLTVIEKLDKKAGFIFFKCRCICGNIKSINKYNLTSGITKSCGCYKLYRLKNSKTHGMSNTKIYIVFKSMERRCNYKKHSNYHLYGGRGIKCKWTSFEEFYKDMGDTYKEGLTLDRRDNDGNYCKDNCRWITNKEQQRNKRNNRLYKGKCISEWCEELGLNRNIVYSRLYKGWSIEKSLEIENTGWKGKFIS